MQMIDAIKERQRLAARHFRQIRMNVYHVKARKNITFCKTNVMPGRTRLAALIFRKIRMIARHVKKGTWSTGNVYVPSTCNHVMWKRNIYPKGVQPTMHM